MSHGHEMPENMRDFAKNFPNHLRKGILFRSGAPDFSSHELIGRPKTIISLRMEDPDFNASVVAPGVTIRHCPIANRIEKYDTNQDEVRQWLATVLKELSEPANVPILIHCRVGRDRTGVVIAVLLRILLGTGYDEAIIEDYRQTSGSKRELITRSFAGLGFTSDDQWIKKYFKKYQVDVQALRSLFLNHHPVQCDRD